MLIFYAILSSCLAVLPPASGKDTRESEAHIYVQISPNPSSTGIFSFETEGCHPEQWIQFRVINVIGRAVIQRNLTPTEAAHTYFDLSQYPKGMYLVEVIQGHCKQVRRIMYR